MNNLVGLKKRELLQVARNIVIDCMGFTPKYSDIHLLECGDAYLFFGLGSASICYMRQSGIGSVCFYPSWDGIDGCRISCDYRPHID